MIKKRILVVVFDSDKVNDKTYYNLAAELFSFSSFYSYWSRTAICTLPMYKIYITYVQPSQPFRKFSIHFSLKNVLLNSYQKIIICVSLHLYIYILCDDFARIQSKGLTVIIYIV